MKNLLLILFLSLQTFALGNAVASTAGNTIQESQASQSVSTPVQAYDTAGEKVWECALDIYGKAKTVEGEASFVRFRFQGQYEDMETGLYYNRFRYYSADSGTYISQDPIGLAGNNPNFYAYTKDSNVWIDVFGLDVVTGAGRTHVKYSGIKDGLPYHGYASAPTDMNLSAQEIIDRRYGNNFDDFDIAPKPDFIGEGIDGKHTARGLEHLDFLEDGGLNGTSNAQSPVGLNNANRDSYLDKANKHKNGKIKCPS